MAVKVFCDRCGKEVELKDRDLFHLKLSGERNGDRDRVYLEQYFHLCGEHMKELPRIFERIMKGYIHNGS